MRSSRPALLSAEPVNLRSRPHEPSSLRCAETQVFVEGTWISTPLLMIADHAPHHVAHMQRLAVERLTIRSPGLGIVKPRFVGCEMLDSSTAPGTGPAGRACRSERVMRDVIDSSSDPRAARDPRRIKRRAPLPQGMAIVTRCIEVGERARQCGGLDIRGGRIVVRVRPAQPRCGSPAVEMEITTAGWNPGGADSALYSNRVHHQADGRRLGLGICREKSRDPRRPWSLPASRAGQYGRLSLPTALPRDVEPRREDFQRLSEREILALAIRSRKKRENRRRFGGRPAANRPASAAVLTACEREVCIATLIDLYRATFERTSRFRRRDVGASCTARRYGWCDRLMDMPFVSAGI